MKTCATCKHWGKGEQLIRRCNNAKIGVEAQDGIFEEGMTYYHEGIYTGFAFGCIHYEPKDNEKPS